MHVETFISAPTQHSALLMRSCVTRCHRSVSLQLTQPAQIPFTPLIIPYSHTNYSHLHSTVILTTWLHVSGCFIRRLKSSGWVFIEYVILTSRYLLSIINNNPHIERYSPDNCIYIQNLQFITLPLMPFDIHSYLKNHRNELIGLWISKSYSSFKLMLEKHRNHYHDNLDNFLMKNLLIKRLCQMGSSI